VDAYLRRLGLSHLAGAPPSADGLRALHRAHTERVPYECLDIWLGRATTVDPVESVGRILRGRGGYCFHLNGALSELLTALGYHVVRHVGGVHGPDGAPEDEMTNHLVLTVTDLPSDDNPDGTWYVDAGLGDALYEPLPLIAGAYDQGPFHLVLEQTAVGVGDWHLRHDPKGAFSGMAWYSAPARMDAFATRHEWLSTSPESGFVKYLTVQRRDRDGVDALRGLSLRRIANDPAESTLTTRAELLETLHDRFGFDIDAIDDDAFDRLWDNVHRAHVKWEAAGRP
jgi:arylamine N-acetyltransferase